MFWIVLSLTADQITKHLASMFLQMQLIPILNFFTLTYATNKGIAFGLFPGVKEVVIYLSLIIVVGISLIPSFVKLKRTTNMSLAFIVGGALGNLIDRIRFGYVIDFITMKYWPTVFNVADIFIFLGSLGLMIELLILEFSGKTAGKATKIENSARDLPISNQVLSRTYEKNRREKPDGYTSHLTRRRLASGQVSNGENTGMDLADIYSKGNKEWRGNSQWSFEETELQGEIWGYNYLECTRETRNSGNSSGEYTT